MNQQTKAWKAYEQNSKTVLKIAVSYHSLSGLILPKLKSPPGSILQFIQWSLADILDGMICLFYIYIYNFVHFCYLFGGEGGCLNFCIYSSISWRPVKASAAIRNNTWNVYIYNTISWRIGQYMPCEHKIYFWNAL